MSKKLFILPALFLGAFLMFTSTSCGDKCKDKDCGNGICIDGTCDCDNGYEVDSKGICNVEVRAKLIGKFSTLEQCSGDPAPFPYDITVTAGATVTDINIFNFFDSFASSAVRATINGNSLTIAAQTPVAGGDLEVAGSGTFQTNSAGKVEMTISYTVVDKSGSNPTASCTGTVFVKQ